MVDFSRDLPLKGYELRLPDGTTTVWCTDCFEESQIDGSLFINEIRKGQYRAGNNTCTDCGELV